MISEGDFVILKRDSFMRVVQARKNGWVFEDNNLMLEYIVSIHAKYLIMLIPVYCQKPMTVHKDV